METQSRQAMVAIDTSSSSTQAPVKRKVYIENRQIGGMNDWRLNREKAQDRTKELLDNWPNSEIWPFKVSLPLLAIAASPNGYILNKALINAFKSKTTVTFTTSNIAMMGVPALMAGAMHYALVTRDIVRQQTGCSTCVQIRAACVQAGIGVLYPFLFAVNQSTTIATDLKIKTFPKIYKDPMPTIRFAVETFSSARTPLMYASVIQMALAIGVTYFQQDFFHSKLLPVARGEVDLFKDKEEL